MFLIKIFAKAAICFVLLYVIVLTISYILPYSRSLTNGYYIKLYSWEQYYSLYSDRGEKVVDNIFEIGYCGDIIYGSIFKSLDTEFEYFVLNTKTNYLKLPYPDFHKSKYYNNPMASSSDMELEYDYDITKVGLERCE